MYPFPEVSRGMNMKHNLQIGRQYIQETLDPIGLCCAQLLSHVLTLCDPMDCSPSGSSVHGILQARILEWVSTPPRDLPKPGIESRSPTLQADSLPSEPPWKPMSTGVGSLSLLQGKKLSNPGIEPGTPASQVDSLPPELPGNLKDPVEKRAKGFSGLREKNKK